MPGQDYIHYQNEDEGSIPSAATILKIKLQCGVMD